MTSSPSSTESPNKKRSIKSEHVESTASSPSPVTPSKKPKTTPSKSPTKADAWTPELRLKLFEAYQASSQTKWDDVAEKVDDDKVGNGKKAKECREQWQRATGKRIKAALAEKS